MSRVRRIQDGVHGLMEFRGMEGVVIELLGTPELQRLRRVRQLGLVHLVFPSAEHSRLAHSLGASYLAIRFGKQLQEVTRGAFAPALCPDEESVRDLAVAALCHDLGHGPLSHAWEREVVGEHFDRSAWTRALGLDPSDEKQYADLKWHELITQGLLAWPDGQLHRLLEGQERGSSTRIQNLLLGKYFLPYIPALLSSDVDVDRADFIARDTLHTGVAYGRYDLEWLISTCTVGVQSNTTGDELFLGFDLRKAFRVVEQFLIARRALYQTVYHHKAVRSAEGMVGKFFARLRDKVREGLDPKEFGFAAPILTLIGGGVLPPDELLQVDDFTLGVVIERVFRGDARDSTLQDLSARISSRRLFRAIDIDSGRLQEFFSHEDAYEELRKEIGKHVKGRDSRYYYHRDTQKFSMLSAKKPQTIHFVDRHGSAVTLQDRTLDEHSLGGEYSTEMLFVAPEALEGVTRLIHLRR